MRFLPVINREEATQLKSLPVVAVDLGFSGRDRTTGIAWSLLNESNAKVYRYGEAVIAVTERFCSIDEVALVLEAPLSAAFDIFGNPRPRGKFEREPQTRWWSVGPGAATALSALFFLQALQFQLKTAKVMIHLVEGFVTGLDSGDHDQVAAMLRDGFRGIHNCLWHSVTEEGSVISVLDWLEGEPPHQSAVILQPLTASSRIT